MSEKTTAPPKTEKIQNSSIFGHFCNNPPHCCNENRQRDAEIVLEFQHKQSMKE